MPQLNPSPWFIILVFSWLVFLIIIPPKITGHSSPKEPTTKDKKETKKLKMAAWGWPWN